MHKKDDIVSNIQKARETTLQNIRLLELEQSQQTIKQENIANRLQEKYFQTIDQLRLQLEKAPEDTPLPVKDMEEEKERLGSRIARIGDVNLGAIDEYDELKTRYDFLIEQQEDLDKAIQDLHKVIKKINRITQERFINTFNAVNEKLAEVFPRLFEGGTAKLILTDPDKPLETGVEYMIHPPGKKTDAHEPSFRWRKRPCPPSLLSSPFFLSSPRLSVSWTKSTRPWTMPTYFASMTC